MFVREHEKLLCVCKKREREDSCAHVFDRGNVRETPGCVRVESIRESRGSVSVKSSVRQRQKEAQCLLRRGAERSQSPHRALRSHEKGVQKQAEKGFQWRHTSDLETGGASKPQGNQAPGQTVPL